jgi:hypothetical protein
MIKIMIMPSRTEYVIRDIAYLGETSSSVVRFRNGSQRLHRDRTVYVINVTTGVTDLKTRHICSCVFVHLICAFPMWF